MVLTCPWKGAHTSSTAQEALWRSLIYRLLTYCSCSNKGQPTVTSLRARNSLVQGQTQLKTGPVQTLTMQSVSDLGLSCMVLLAENVTMSS